MFTRDQFVTISFGGRSMRGMVLLVSPNGKSLMLGFDGALAPSRGEGMYLGSMLVLMDDDGVYRDVFNDELVGIEPIA